MIKSWSNHQDPAILCILIIKRSENIDTIDQYDFLKRKSGSKCSLKSKIRYNDFFDGESNSMNRQILTGYFLRSRRMRINFEDLKIWL